MPESTDHFDRRPTGIAGLDRILEGGLLGGGVYIVQGPPGAGKTILASHVCFNCAVSGQRVVYATLLAESHARMMAHLRRMDFFDESLIPDHIYYIGGFSTLESGGLGALVTMVRGAIQKRQASLLVIDGLVSAQESASTDREFKKFIHELQTAAALTGCTILLLTNSERAAGFSPEHTMVDGVLHLTDELSQLRPLRHIQVLKMRGSAPVRGLHSVRISDRGFQVQPRIEALFTSGRSGDLHAAGSPKLPFGVEALDQMLRGGVRASSVTMLLGSSGSGKTLLGMQFLAEGLKRRERVVYFGFYEHPETIVAKCQRTGIRGIREGIERGDARVLWHRPVEGIIDEVGASLFEVVRETQATRLVIDGMQGFELAADFKSRVPSVYATIAQELEHLGVTTIYTTELQALFSPAIEVPIEGLSAATQNIVLLRHIEYRARMLRVLAILKVRDGDYDPTMREIQITDDGIRLGDTFANESRLVSGGGVAAPSPRPRQG